MITGKENCYRLNAAINRSDCSVVFDAKMHIGRTTYKIRSIDLCQAEELKFVAVLSGGRRQPDVAGATLVSGPGLSKLACS